MEKRRVKRRVKRGVERRGRCWAADTRGRVNSGLDRKAFSFPASGPAQPLGVIRSPSYISLLRETTVASLLRNGINCSEPS